jgi:hypothetical protein
MLQGFPTCITSLQIRQLFPPPLTFFFSPEDAGVMDVILDEHRGITPIDLAGGIRVIPEIIH